MKKFVTEKGSKRWRQMMKKQAERLSLNLTYEQDTGKKERGERGGTLPQPQTHHGPKPQRS
jgi:hypothetical protein